MGRGSQGLPWSAQARILREQNIRVSGPASSIQKRPVADTAEGIHEPPAENPLPKPNLHQHGTTCDTLPKRSWLALPSLLMVDLAIRRQVFPPRQFREFQQKLGTIYLYGHIRFRFTRLLVSFHQFEKSYHLGA